MPQLIRFMLTHFGIGAGCGTAAALYMVAAYPGASGQILRGSDQALLAALMLAVALASTFGVGSIATALALMDRNG
jgi:hypothetical protein